MKDSPPNASPEINTSQPTLGVASMSANLPQSTDISPISASQYAAQQTKAPSQNIPTSSKPEAPPNMSNIYPRAVTSPRLHPPPDGREVGEQNNSTRQYQQDKRVVSQVPALQVYAFIIIIYGLYSVAVMSNFGRPSITGTAGIYSVGNSLVRIMLVLAAINIATGIYLLLAKNSRTVSSLLTALLIVGGLSLLNTLLTSLRYMSSISTNTIISLCISGGLLIYLWSVKSKIDIL